MIVMDLLWTLMKYNQRLKRVLPNSLVTWVRHGVESLSCLWKRNYYSQFGEDAVLQNIFREMAWNQAVKSKSDKMRTSRGFYVDIGAFAPIQHSNTYWFYKRGWRGINIDATPGSMRIFRWIRRRDINLETAISSQETEMTYYCWGIPHVMNTISKENADQITRRSGQIPKKVTVKSRTLEHVLDEYLPLGQTIDFLTLDVENHNLEVLKSNNWTKYKPRIVLVEADNDSSTFEAVLSSEMTTFMKSRQYSIVGWVRPTVIFKLDQPD
jgi:FkbM family methyltransferase